MKYFLIFVLLLGCCSSAWAQNDFSCADAKIKSYNQIKKKSRAGVSDNALMERYDVNWYFLDLNIENNTTVLSGSGTIKAKMLVPSDTFCFELNSNLTIDSIIHNNNNIPFAHTPSTHICYAKPFATLNANTQVEMRIYYHGDASVVGGSAIGDGFSTDTSPTWGNSVTWSLSQPYSAFEWFPCKQFLQDKADSAWVYVTTSNLNKVGSNGILQGVDSLTGNKVRYRWKTHYTLDYYLISVAVAKYVDYITYAHPLSLPNDSIQILNYVYDNPNTLPFFKNDIDSTAMLIEYFSDILGLYPYHQEKYGHSMAPFSGGMEHQTMTSLGSFNFSLIAHELFHQWFGDYVTCSTWSDIFINEGFASYGQYLAFEKFRSLTNAQSFMQGVHTDVMDQPDGSIYFTDTTNVGRIFSSRLSYKKGNAVIHSLRFELGDSVFFQSLKNFLTQKAFSNGSILDLKNSAENTSGKNLTDFFNQWIFGEGYPIFSAKYFTDGTNLYLRMTHTASTATTPTFITSLEIKCKSALNGDTTVKIQITTNDDTYIIPLNKLVNGLEIDPNNWILNEVGTISLDPTLITLGTNPLFDHNEFSVYPNPAEEQIVVSNPIPHQSTYKVMNMLGEVISEKTCDQGKVLIDISQLSPATYLIRIENGQGQWNKKFIKR